MGKECHSEAAGVWSLAFGVWPSRKIELGNQVGVSRFPTPNAKLQTPNGS